MPALARGSENWIVKDTIQDTMTLASILTLFEGIEQSENFEGETVKVNNNNKVAKKSGKSGQKSGNGGTKYCMLHGENTSHNSDQCRILQAQAKRLKTTGGGGGSGKGSYGNKTWSRKANDAQKKAMKEINAFAKATYKKHFEANAVQEQDEDSNKRPYSESESSESEEEGEVHMMEEQMFNLDIASSGSVTGRIPKKKKKVGKSKKTGKPNKADDITDEIDV